MKSLALFSISLTLVTLLSSCAAHNTAETPSLSANSAPTSRLPSPGNPRANAYMQGSTMTVPTRP